MSMYELIQSTSFSRWLGNLKDLSALARIEIRLQRMGEGNLGDVKPVGNGISEARIHYGPGYRLYFIKRKTTILVLLIGGDKATQKTDIAKAKEIAKQWEA